MLRCLCGSLSNVEARKLQSSKRLGRSSAPQYLHWGRQPLERKSYAHSADFGSYFATSQSICLLVNIRALAAQARSLCPPITTHASLAWKNQKLPVGKVAFGFVIGISLDQ